MNSKDQVTKHSYRKNKGAALREFRLATFDKITVLQMAYGILHRAIQVENS